MSPQMSLRARVCAHMSAHTRLRVHTSAHTSFGALTSLLAHKNAYMCAFLPWEPKCTWRYFYFREANIWFTFFILLSMAAEINYLAPKLSSLLNLSSAQGRCPIKTPMVVGRRWYFLGSCTQDAFIWFFFRNNYLTLQTTQANKI